MRRSGEEQVTKLAFEPAIIGQQRVDGMSQKVVELCLADELIAPDFDGGYELPAAA